jgi:ribonuclease HI
LTTLYLAATKNLTNNVVEYEALINGLRIAAELGIQWLYIHGDSKLIVNRVMRELNCHDFCMEAHR